MDDRFSQFLLFQYGDPEIDSVQKSQIMERNGIRAAEETRLRLLTGFGLAFVACHIAESHLRVLIDYKLADRKHLLDKILSKDRDKRTLGSLKSALKGAVELPSEFSKFLDDFVERRNELVHHISDHSAWNWVDEFKMCELYEYVSETRKMAVRLIASLAPLVRAFPSDLGNKMEPIEFLNLIDTDEEARYRQWGKTQM